MIWSIIYFFVLTIGLGHFIDLFLDWNGGTLEKAIMRLGVGLGLIPIIGVIFNVVKIPLDWKIFLGAAIFLPLLSAILKKKTIFSDIKGISFSGKIKKSQIYILLVLIMFVITAYMYIHGSFVFPYFEDSDGWEYAYISKYIADTKSYSADFHFDHFAEPYTQGYQIVMAMLFQSHGDSLYWSMKFFQSLIISFSILFFYFFVRRFSKSYNVALLSAFALFAVPAWLSHFVFSLTFNMTLMLVLFYAVSRIREDKRWKYVAVPLFASILVSHFYTAVIITVLLVLFYLNKVFVEARFNKDYLQVMFFGFILSLLFWATSLLKFRKELLNISGLGGLEIFFPYFIGTGGRFKTTFLC